jgi:hypothetical protein
MTLRCSTTYTIGLSVSLREFMGIQHTMWIRDKLKGDGV